MLSLSKLGIIIISLWLLSGCVVTHDYTGEPHAYYGQCIGCHSSSFLDSDKRVKTNGIEFTNDFRLFVYIISFELIELN